MSKSIFNGAGYFMNDDRASGGALAEDDTVGCKHCSATMKKRDWKMRGELRCSMCDRPLCEMCGAKPPSLKCMPIEAQIERALTEAHRREQNAKILGI